MSEQQSTLDRTDIYTFLHNIAPFSLLSESDLAVWIGKMKPLKFRMGQKILVHTQLPKHLSIVFSGKVRLVGIEPTSSKPVSLQILEPGGILGGISLVRDLPCETALASEETVCFILPAADFAELRHRHPEVESFDLPHRAEIFDLVTHYFQHQHLTLPKGKALSRLVERVWEDAILATTLPDTLATERFWFDSRASNNYLGVPLRLDEPDNALGEERRLIGLSAHLLTVVEAIEDTWAETSAVSAIMVDYAPEVDFPVTTSEFAIAPSQIAVEYSDGKFPSVKGEGTRNGILACFQMLSLYLGIKYRRETVQRLVDMQLERNSKATIHLCAAIAEVLGLMGRLMDVPPAQISRIKNPAIIAWEDSYAVIYQVSEKEIVLGTPQTGVERIKFDRFVSLIGEGGKGKGERGDECETIQVLLLQETKNVQRHKFDLAWFIPFVKPESKVLVEVLVASFFVQVLGLANPLLVQVIIDRVLGQNSQPTLMIFGILLMVL